MFEKSLTDLIRGIRANKKNEQKYIQVCLQEIRNEVKSNDVDVKGVAIAKLTYVCMHASLQGPTEFNSLHSLASNAWLRHVLGLLPRSWSHVKPEART